MQKTTYVGIIGIAGFASTHLDALKTYPFKETISLVAACETNLDYQERLDSLKSVGVRTYNTCDAMFESEKGKLDFIIIPTSIASHRYLAIRAMKFGFNVLVEKPPAPTIQDVNAMLKTSKETGAFCAIGFQYRYTNSFLKVLEIIQNKELGNLIHISCGMLWKRDNAYFSRNEWAGKIKLNNHWIMDGSISNPGAHALDSILYLGAAGDKYTSIKSVNCEFYHVNNIESEDTASLQAELDNGITIHLATTLCANTHQAISFNLQFEDGTLEWEHPNKLTIKKNNTKSNTLIIPERSQIYQHLIYKNIIQYLNKKAPLLYDISKGILFTKGLNCAYESALLIHKIPSEYCTKTIDNDNYLMTINNIEEIITQALKEKKQISEIIRWGKKSTTFNCSNYQHFPQYYK